LISNAVSRFGHFYSVIRHTLLLSFTLPVNLEHCQRRRRPVTVSLNSVDCVCGVVDCRRVGGRQW